MVQLSTGVIQIAGERPDALADIGVIGASVDADLVSIVRGSTDRRLLSPYQLGRVDGDQRIVQASSLAAAVGRFDATTGLDLAVLAISRDPSSTGSRERNATLWSVPRFGEASLSPQATEGAVIHAAGAESSLALDAAVMAAIDLDAPSADAVDELVLLAPPRLRLREESQGTGPGKLVVARMNGNVWEKGEEIELGGRTELDDDPKITWKVVAADVDGDGANDLVVLFDEGGETKVSVFFNGANGRLDPSPITVSIPGLTIVDFAAFQADDQPNKELVLMTRESGDEPESARSGLYLVHVEERAFREPVGPLTDGDEGSGRKLPGAFGRGSGDSIAAGDADGDGVDDLIVQRAGALFVFRGVPVVRR